MEYKIILLLLFLFLASYIIKYFDNKRFDNKSSKKIMSRTEYRIAEYLDKLNVNYKAQYTFAGCRDKNKLPFDFAIIDEKGVVKMLIEYDGEQHFQPVQFGNETKKEAMRNFKICQKHDKIKNNFCKRRKIYLLRISYLENKDLYKIIKRTLYEQNILK